MCYVEFGDEGEIGRVMVFGFGRKAGNQIGPDRDVRSSSAQAFDQTNGIVARVAALHAFENKVMPMLQREVQMRHDARL